MGPLLVAVANSGFRARETNELSRVARSGLRPRRVPVSPAGELVLEAFAGYLGLSSDRLRRATAFARPYGRRSIVAPGIWLHLRCHCPAKFLDYLSQGTFAQSGKRWQPDHPGPSAHLLRGSELIRGVVEMSEPERRLDWIAPASVGALAFGVLFAGVPYSLGYGLRPSSLWSETWAMWKGFPDWSHGMLVFPLVGLLLYCQRARLARVPVRGSWLGLPVLVFSGLLYWAGFLADVQYLGYAALQVLIAGLTLWYCGTRFFRAVFFAWAFLIFAWPFVFLDQYVAFPLRLLMSSASVRVLNAVGVATVRSGTSILSVADPVLGVATGQRFSVDVADPCSGMHSLFALTMVAAFYGILVFRRWWQVLVIVLAAVPLAVMGNLCRIVMLTFGTMAFGSAFAIGTDENPTWFHLGAGFLVYFAALGGVLIIGAFIQRFFVRARSRAGL